MDGALSSDCRYSCGNPCSLAPATTNALYQWYGRSEGSVAVAMYATALTVPQSVMISTCRSTYPLLRPSARSSAGFSVAFNSKSTPQTTSSIWPVASVSHFPEPSRLRLCHLRTCPSKRPVPIATADGTRSRNRAVSMLEPYANVQMRAPIGSDDLPANDQAAARQAVAPAAKCPAPRWCPTNFRDPSWRTSGIFQSRDPSFSSRHMTFGRTRTLPRA